jgi:hypothetical protein
VPSRSRPAPTTTPSSPATWSGQRCKDFDASDTLCVNVHTIPYQNGMRVDQVQLCFDSHPSWPYIGATKTFNNTLTYYGSAGNWIGFTNVKDTNANACTLTNDVVQMGNGACYKMTGRIDFPAGPDSDWAGLNGKVLGGAYNC